MSEHPDDSNPACIRAMKKREDYIRRFPEALATFSRQEQADFAVLAHSLGLVRLDVAMRKWDEAYGEDCRE